MAHAGMSLTTTLKKKLEVVIVKGGGIERWVGKRMG